jgi:hypothetical protein
MKEKVEIRILQVQWITPGHYLKAREGDDHAKIM